MVQTPREDQRPAETNILLSSPHPSEIYSSRFSLCPGASQTWGCGQHSPPLPARGPTSQRKAPSRDRPPHSGLGPGEQAQPGLGTGS